MALADRIPLLKQALVRAGAEDDGNVITIPHSVDGLIDQVKRIESRQTTTEARHAAELASLTWQHKLDRDALDKRHALEKQAVDEELARASDLMFKTMATKLGVDPAVLLAAAGDAPASSDLAPVAEADAP
jgi:hypothetical protein